MFNQVINDIKSKYQKFKKFKIPEIIPSPKLRVVLGFFFYFIF